MAVAGAFTQAKTSTNSFSIIPQKIAKVNSLDAGPLIALVFIQDDYHQECKAGFSNLPALFGEVLTALPVLFE
ncbi:hypothetical protein [Nostoc sp. WHI]|uniref:hypothetical protein n=1 Tax=Nostoc sp. WHI TaxID=2650611 RepID=UPI0018C70873|nr:hypothetical protein [Nostoc sp. WHI]MBG1270778.1 hypothetical protein [Nostoc sp. WHI]